MKRFVAFLGIAMLLVGIRLYDTGLYRFSGGDLTVYGQTEYCPDIFFVTDQPYRIDGISKQTLDSTLKKAKAKIVKTEMDGALVYAYSPLISRTEWLGSTRFNIMIHTSASGKISIGVPILMGSY